MDTFTCFQFNDCDVSDMWCDLGESVGSRTCDIFSFLFDWSPHLERYILQKTPPESDQWFQSYNNWKILKTIQNKKEMHSFFWLYLTINAADSRLISLDRNTLLPKIKHLNIALPTFGLDFKILTICFIPVELSMLIDPVCENTNIIIRCSKTRQFGVVTDSNFKNLYLGNWLDIGKWHKTISYSTLFDVEV